MLQPATTSWELVEQAASGDPERRAEFAALYGPWIRSLLAARWRDKPLLLDLEDATQEVFVECLKPGGVLAKADRGKPQGFRPFLGGVVRNVALRYEKRAARRRARQAARPPDETVPSAATSVSRLLDREWALARVREAAEAMAKRAERLGGSAPKRVELLRLRFQDDLELAAIAERWQVDPGWLHHQFAKARREFRAELLGVLARQRPGARPEELEAECQTLLRLLG